MALLQAIVSLTGRTVGRILSALLDWAVVALFGLARVLKTGSLLVSKEVELARTEIKADLTAELGMVKFHVAGAVAAVLGVNLLLVSAVFALASWLPGWLASLSLAALVLAVSAGLGLLGWQRRVSSPLAVTRKTVKEDMQWAKERLA